MAVPELRSLVERHFRVYEAREERMGGQVAARIFCVMFPAGEFDSRFAALRTELRAVDPELVAFLRRDGGEDVLYIARRPAPPPAHNATAWVLMALTVFTTTVAGMLWWHGFAHPLESMGWSQLVDREHVVMGFLTFALPIMAILGIHETAHFIAAKRHGLRATLPRFLPLPPFPPFALGTLGAFISLRDELPDRKALFDVGASGPIAGFLVAIPILLLGAHLTSTAHHELPDLGHPLLSASLPFDDTQLDPGKEQLRFHNATAGTLSFTVQAPTVLPNPWAYTATANVQLADGNTTTTSYDAQLDPGHMVRRTLTLPPGTRNATLTISWNSGLVTFNDPALVGGVQIAGKRIVPGVVDAVWPENQKLLTHPLYFAGWVGLLVTGINLLPIGQLDGGHVARALLGDRMRYVAYGSVFGLMALVFVFGSWSWILLAAFVLWMGVVHPPPLNDRTPLGKLRVALGIFVLLVFLLSFVPVPIQ